MKPIYSVSTLLVVANLTACVQPMPRYEAEFGETVRNTLNAQIIHPEAGNNPDTVTGVDGRAARDAIHNYQKSFAKPESAPSVFNIGVGNDNNSSGN